MIQEVFHVSRLAATASPSCVADIVRVARGFSLRNDVTGALFFKGEQFLHLLEGSIEPVTTLMTRKASDFCHLDLQVLQLNTRLGELRFRC